VIPIFPPPLKYYILGDLKSHAKYQNTRTTPFGKKVTGVEKEKEKKEKKMPLIVATPFCLECPRAAHAAPSDQFIQTKSYKYTSLY
jgi:hypothetical protein